MLSLIISLAGIAAAIWGLSVFGSPDAARDEFVARLALAFAGLAVFPLIYLYWIRSIPGEWDKQKQEKIDELEDSLAAKITFAMPPNCLWSSTEGTTISIGIFNPSGVTIKSVFVELDRFVSGPSLGNLPRRLRLRSENLTKFDLAPGKTEYVLIATIRKGDEAKIEFEFPDKSVWDVMRHGNYKLKLKAYGDGIRPINQFFPFTVNETGEQLSFGPLELEPELVTAEVQAQATNGR